MNLFQYTYKSIQKCVNISMVVFYVIYLLNTHPLCANTAAGGARGNARFLITSHLVCYLF